MLSSLRLERETRVPGVSGWTLLSGEQRILSSAFACAYVQVVSTIGAVAEPISTIGERSQETDVQLILSARLWSRLPALQNCRGGSWPQLGCGVGPPSLPHPSPWAKGRVERKHGVYQDRFVKVLRLAGITSIEVANEFVQGSYPPAINARFAKKAAQPEDAHVPLLGKTDLRDVFCFQHKRVVSRDWVVQFKRRVYQIPSAMRGLPRGRRW